MFKKPQWFAFILFFSAFLAGCNAGTASQTPSPNLEGTAWNLVSITTDGKETPILPDSAVTLEFTADQRAGGNAGCNQYSGGYEVEGEKISFQSIASTLMACADEGRMEQETSYLKALSEATRFERSGEQLILFFGSGQDSLTFKPGSPSTSATASPTQS